MDTARAPPGTGYPILRSSHLPARDALCDSGAMTEPDDLRRRDPAWLWYSLAAAALVVLLVLDVTGVLDRFGP